MVREAGAGDCCVCLQQHMFLSKGSQQLCYCNNRPITADDYGLILTDDKAHAYPPPAGERRAALVKVYEGWKGSGHTSAW